MIDALTHLRETGLVPLGCDRGRDPLAGHLGGPRRRVAEYVADAVNHACLDRWGGRPAPLILCESRSLAGTLRDLAGPLRRPHRVHQRAMPVAS